MAPLGLGEYTTPPENITGENLKMPSENETPTGENENLEAQGTTEAQATGSTSAEEPEKLEEGQAPDATSLEDLRAELEAIRKEKQKVEMERNHLKNKQEEDRRKQLEEEGNWKQLAEEREAELNAIREAEEERAAREAAQKLREEEINSYPNEAVRKAALKLIEKNPRNLVWSEDTDTEESARAQIKDQLDALAETLGVSADNEEYPEIGANNPNPSQGPSEIDKLKSLSSDELRKVLPIADPR